ncbi:MAG: SPOR domain-containing protein [Candidatus Azobacteroides sp.]|nr:SPOR domain-containing protein [Candidatus Azobacteroides sp.]
MKNSILIIGIVLGITVLAGSCKSSKESAYRAAYEKAKTKEVSSTSRNDNQDVVVYNPPASTAPATQNVTTKTEKITPVNQSDADQLKRYSVVIYSFMNKTNASAAKEEMVKHGYDVILAQNENNMYRVIIASYDDKASAVAKRDEVKAKYAPRFDDIWILEKQY